MAPAILREVFESVVDQAEHFFDDVYEFNIEDLQGCLHQH
jgi:hypothetical protein